MAVMPYLSVFGLLIFAGISFFFALAESALFSLGKWQVQKLTEASAKGGEKVASLLSNPQHLLATIVLGNTVANACILAIAIWDSPPGRLSHLLLIGVLFIVILFI